VSGNFVFTSCNFIKDLVDRAKHLYKEQKFHESLCIYKELLRINPGCADIQNDTGVLYSAAGQFDTSCIYFLKALDIDPFFAYAHNNLANSLRKQNKIEQALAHYKKALELKSDVWQFYYNHASAFYETARWEDGIALALQGLQYSGNNYHMSTLLGLLYSEHMETDRAIEWLKNAIDINPSSFLPFMYAGTIFHKNEHYELAMEYYKKSLHLNKDNACIYKYIGDLYHDLGNFKQSIRYYQKATEVKIGKGTIRAETLKVFYLEAMSTD